MAPGISEIHTARELLSYNERDYGHGSNHLFIFAVTSIVDVPKNRMQLTILFKF
jgi:hypothetical protein